MIFSKNNNRKLLSISTVVIVSILLVSFFSLISLAASDKIFLNVGTTNKASSAYGYYVQTLKVFNKYAPNLKPTIIETGAAVDNTNRLARKEIDIGLAPDSIKYQAYNGIGKWEGKPVSNLRNMLSWAKNMQPYVVKADSDIMTPYDLDGLGFCCGARGSACEATCEMILDSLGVEPEFFRGSLTDATNAMKDRRIDGLLKTSCGNKPDAAFLELQTYLKLKPINWSVETLELVKEDYPYFSTGVIPAGTFNGQTEDANSWSVVMGDFATTELSEEAAYLWVKACFQGKDMLAQVYPAAGEADWVEATLGSLIPLHAGTIKYFREIGVEIPEELIPPEAK
ncbi:MAG: TAXI family TRAP transporter solute-binding subunit [Candidatus Caldatribacteriota bacterium]|nr:TAXI family TRAP transporter solute-binding subunit [Candidatus Caldatribacteriota bacterium]